jgi:hypothetical protein
VEGRAESERCLDGWCGVQANLVFPILPLFNTDDSSVTEENEKEEEPELSRRREALHEVDGDDEPQWKWW